MSGSRLSHACGAPAARSRAGHSGQRSSRARLRPLRPTRISFGLFFRSGSSIKVTITACPASCKTPATPPVKERNVATEILNPAPQTKDRTPTEGRAASKAANEVVWLRRLLTSWGHSPTAPAPLYEDNTACISTSLLPGQTNRNKHIDIKMHNIKANISSGTVRLIQCPSHDNFSDALTKCLPKDTHSRHTLVLLGITPTTGPPLFVDSTCDHLSLLDAPTSSHKQGESEDVTA